MGAPLLGVAPVTDRIRYLKVGSQQYVPPTPTSESAVDAGVLGFLAIPGNPRGGECACLERGLLLGVDLGEP